MLDINLIRKNPELIRKTLKERNMKVNVDQILKLDKKRRVLLKKVEDLRAEQNKASQFIAKSSGQEKIKKITETKEIAQRISELAPVLEKVENKYNKLMYSLPNICLPDVPVGPDESGNQVVRKQGKIKLFDFQVKDHVQLGEDLNIIDLKRAAKVTGARFAYIKGAAAMLQTALIKYTFETLTSEKIINKVAESVKRGYSAKTFIPIFPPVVLKPEVFSKMARLSKEDEDERYYIKSDDLYLVGSAEHTIGSMHMDEIISEEDLPIRYIGYATSFRREAGSYGKDTKGIFRVHQFDKMEMESFTLSDHSKIEQEFLVAIQEYMLQDLKIPYQVVNVCTGDMGKPDARQIDIECYLPGQKKYRETHTSDLMTDYQSRRLNIRVKRSNGKNEYVHMNDATAFAVGRIIIAILENYQNKDGSVSIPEKLKPYMNGIEKII